MPPSERLKMDAKFQNSTLWYWKCGCIVSTLKFCWKNVCNLAFFAIFCSIVNVLDFDPNGDAPQFKFRLQAANDGRSRWWNVWRLLCSCSSVIAASGKRQCNFQGRGGRGKFSWAGVRGQNPLLLQIMMLNRPSFLDKVSMNAFLDRKVLQRGFCSSEKVVMCQNSDARIQLPWVPSDRI